NAKQAASCLHEADVGGRGSDLRWHMRQTLEIFEGTVYRFNRLKTDAEEKPLRLASITLLVDKSDKAQAETGLHEGRAIAHGMALARDLANLPGNICTPVFLAEEAAKLHKSHPRLKVEIL